MQAYLSNDCSFVGNSALYGGALYLDTNANLTIHNSTVLNNSANINGGAVYQQDSTIALVTAGSRILGNTAGEGGGGIFCSANAQIAVTAYSLVLGNHADNGGGLCARNSALVSLPR